MRLDVGVQPIDMILQLPPARSKASLTQCEIGMPLRGSFVDVHQTPGKQGSPARQHCFIRTMQEIDGVVRKRKVWDD